MQIGNDKVFAYAAQTVQLLLLFPFHSSSPLPMAGYLAECGKNSAVKQFLSFLAVPRICLCYAEKCAMEMWMRVWNNKCNICQQIEKRLADTMATAYLIDTMAFYRQSVDRRDRHKRMKCKQQTDS